MPFPLLIFLLAAVMAAPAMAANLIRDAEIEQTLKRVANPIFRAALLNPATVHIFIVEDPEMNAFVAGGQNIFINTGMLTNLKSIDQLRAVIAHETGHIADGHLARRDQGLQGPRTIALLGMVGAAAATIGGSPQAGLAIAAGSQQTAQRRALAYSRAEEASADQAGLRYVAAAGGDPNAMLEVLRRFEGQEALTGAQVDPFVQSHPMWSDRIDMLEQRVAKLPKGKPPAPEDVYWYDRMVAKVDAFLRTPAQTIRAHPISDTSETATLARAIAWHREPDIARGTAETARLIAMRPDDPYYLELKGQFLLESGQAAPAAEAYRAAAARAPKEPLILGGLGRALLNTDDDANIAEARDVLARAVTLDRTNPSVWRDLAYAEARLGHEGQAALATAERFLAQGKPTDAARNARRASDLLPVGSPGWQRAQDMIFVTRRAQK